MIWKEEKNNNNFQIFVTLVLKGRRHLFFWSALSSWILWLIFIPFRISRITHNASEMCDLLLALERSAALSASRQLELVAGFNRLLGYLCSRVNLS